MVKESTQSGGTRRFNPLRKLLIGCARKKATDSIDNNKDNNNIKTVTKDARVILFSHTESNVSQYKLDYDESDLHVILRNHKPSVISQGKFQIYTINMIFNYFTSGSLTHPILPSSQFIKINSNTYIIPIRNRRRYWKLSLNTEDNTIIEEFEKVLDSIAKLKINMVVDFPLPSPFTSFINPSDCPNITNKNNILTSNSDSLILYHPVPVRPQTSSTVSINTNSLDNTNADISSLNTTYSDIDKIEIDNDDDIDIIHDVSSSDLLTIENIQDPDIDLDYDLKKSEEEDMEDNVIEQFDHSSDSYLHQFDNNKLQNNIHISKRYSLTFKDYDDLKPISTETMHKYKHTIKNLIRSESNTGLFDNLMK